MFNEQGCRNPAPSAIAPHHFRVRMCIWLKSGYPRSLGEADYPLGLSLQRSEAAQANIIAALFRSHFFRFVPVCNPVGAVVWNHLKRPFFLLHPAPVLNIQLFNPSSECFSIP
jgi:hypothetical protein